MWYLARITETHADVAVIEYGSREEAESMIGVDGKFIGTIPVFGDRAEKVTDPASGIEYGRRFE
jgi:hypothetical protein